MTDLLGVPLESVGLGFGWVLVAMFVTLVLRGDLVSRKTLEAQVALLENRIDERDHEANEWRTEGRIKDTQIAEKDTQLRHLAEVGKSVESIMHALQKARSGGSEVAP
ncbi:MAG TPA: hypothetical protein VJ782_08755 [Aeromicrobium sp.]|nr:hypothetical protein [Aeromicrobium sp.]